ncbi:MAG: AmmeMemoRadiSam system protein B [Methylococcaceae bacterium]|jgi:hypothetical protein
MNRQPAVAGMFYPANPGQLHQMLDQYLTDAETNAKVPKAIIVPHAGYTFSGAVAASAYARLKKANDLITRVVLIGPSHCLAFKGLAVTRAQTFSTPLGNISVDQKAISQLVKLPYVEFIEEAHAHEHSLEVQLPFLQEMLDNFDIIPIIAGEVSAHEICHILELLWGGEETLIVVSSDLSHYLDYASAKQMDAETSLAIVALADEKLAADSACGKTPVCGLIKYAQEQALAIQCIDLRNSGDTAGDKNRVVGYGAYVIE